jgi:hypothetical protein
MVLMPHDQRTLAAQFEANGRHARKLRRRSLRRAFSVDCSLECDYWEGPVVLQATDVSDEGLWLETPYALQQGEEIVVSFPVPGAPDAERIWAIAEVARVGMWRRRDDGLPPGMGLVFTYCSQEDLNRLSDSLYGRPPHLPVEVRARTGALPPPTPLRRVEEPELTLGDAPPLPAVLDWLLASE